MKIIEDNCEHLFESHEITERFSKHYNRNIFIPTSRCVRCGIIASNIKGCVLSKEGKHTITESTKTIDGIIYNFKECPCGLYLQYPVE